MRPELLNPVRDQRRLDAAIAMAQELYALHEAGRDYSTELDTFARFVGTPVSKFDLDGAFGSIDAGGFAESLLTDRSQVPKDLSEGEMVDLIERICKAKGTESQISYWLNCLKANTGDQRLSDLIFWPGEYFGDGYNSRKMSPQEILRTAMSNGRSAAG
jgi:hypothetical protein